MMTTEEELRRIEGLRQHKICPITESPCRHAHRCTLLAEDACSLLITQVYRTCEICREKNPDTTCAAKFRCFKLDKKGRLII